MTHVSTVFRVVGDSVLAVTFMGSVFFLRYCNIWAFWCFYVDNVIYCSLFIPCLTPAVWRLVSVYWLWLASVQ
jgi:hypothetical protein